MHLSACCVFGTRHRCAISNKSLVAPAIISALSEVNGSVTRPERHAEVGIKKASKRTTAVYNLYNEYINSDPPQTQEEEGALMAGERQELPCVK